MRPRLEAGRPVRRLSPPPGWELMVVLMLKIRPLCTSAEPNFGDRVLGEVEKKSVIALPGKVGHSGLMPTKTECPNLGGFGEELYSNGSRAGLLIRIRARTRAGSAFL